MIEPDDKTKLEEEIRQSAVELGIDPSWAGGLYLKRGQDGWFLDIQIPPPRDDFEMSNRLKALAEKYEARIQELSFY